MHIRANGSGSLLVLLLSTQSTTTDGLVSAEVASAFGLHKRATRTPVHIEQQQSRNDVLLRFSSSRRPSWKQVLLRPSPPFAAQPSRLFSDNYGRGSEIWPPANEDQMVQLEDSFPQGKIPKKALALLEQYYFAQENNKQLPPSKTTNKKTWLDRFPALLVVVLLGWIRPLDVGLVVTVSVYTAILTMAAKSLRPSGTLSICSSLSIPTLPSLPPQGHVPQMVQNPMHYDLSYSFGYDVWWRLGIGLGFVLPTLSIAYAAVALPASSLYAVLSVLARPLFLLSCQALSELLCRDWLLPLPIRIWIPISYQVIRLVYLGLGLATLVAMSSSSIWFGSWVQLLTGVNLVYTAANVFGFLLPVALMRYMRAHFFGVEAATVTIHAGMEESVGLSPTLPSDDEKI